MLPLAGANLLRLARSERSFNTHTASSTRKASSELVVALLQSIRIKPSNHRLKESVMCRRSRLRCWASASKSNRVSSVPCCLKYRWSDTPRSWYSLELSFHQLSCRGAWLPRTLEEHKILFAKFGSILSHRPKSTNVSMMSLGRSAWRTVLAAKYVRRFSASSFPPHPGVPAMHSPEAHKEPL